MALAGRVSRLQRKAATGTASHVMPRVPKDPTSTLGTLAASSPRRFHVLRSPYPPETCLHLHCTATLALAGRVSRLQRKPAAGAARRGMPCVPRDLSSTLGTLAASSPRRLQVLHSPYPPETGLCSHYTLGTCRARLPPATQGSGWRCTSRAASGLQGPDKHSRDARCIQPTPLARVALAIPT